MLNIIIPVRDNPTWLSMCLTALHSWTNTQYTITIVDNESKEPETKKLLQEFALFEADRRLRGRQPSTLHTAITPIELNLASDIPLIIPHNNSSFSNSINVALQQITPRPQDYVCILNSDVIVQKGWDSQMIADLAAPNVGMVGARTNAAIGWQGDPDGALLSSGSGGGPSPEKGIEPPYLIFMCVMARREVIEKVGLLDSETCQGWGGGEDWDYSWRIQAAGYRLAISNAYVLHGCSQTYAQEGLLNVAAPGEEPPKAKLERANIARLTAKWGAQKVHNQTAVRPIIMLGIVSRTPLIHKGFVESLMMAIRIMTSYGMHVEITWVTRTFVNVAREKVTDIALKKASTGQDFTHLIFVDDDQVFPPDAMMRLIKCDKDVVAPIVYMRFPPYGTCVFEWTAGTDKPGDVPTDKVLGSGYSSMEGIEGTGVRQVAAVGFGMVCMKVGLLKRLKTPIADGGKGITCLYPFAAFGEDMSFCQIVNANGGSVWCDTDMILGHLGDPVLVDHKLKQEWVAKHGLGDKKLEK